MPHYVLFRFPLALNHLFLSRSASEQFHRSARGAPRPYQADPGGSADV